MKNESPAAILKARIAERQSAESMASASYGEKLKLEPDAYGNICLVEPNNGEGETRIRIAADLAPWLVQQLQRIFGV